MDTRHSGLYDCLIDWRLVAVRRVRRAASASPDASNVARAHRQLVNSMLFKSGTNLETMLNNL